MPTKILGWMVILSLIGCHEVSRPVTAAEQRNAIPVHIKGGDGITLAEYQGYDPDADNGSWQPVCNTPCTANLYHNRYYRVQGVARKDSAPVMLPSAPSVSGTATGGSTALVLLGSSLVVVGAIGGFMFIRGTEYCSPEYQCTSKGEDKAARLRAAGLTMLIAGPILGGVAIHFGRSTSLEFKIER